MRLKELHVENWGPHENLTCDLDSPMTGIIGANGKGKSCLLTAISYAVTGVLPFAKERYIREYDPENPERSTKAYKAVVRLKFEVNGQEGEITRTIWDAGTSRSLKYAGCTHTKQADVDGLMEELMGADKAALQNAVFIKQGELTELIQGTPATRQEIFRRLMNLNFLSIRADDVKSKLRLLDARGAVDNSELIDSLKSSLTENEKKQKETADKVAPLEKVMAEKDKVEELDRQLQEFNNLRTRRDTLQELAYKNTEAIAKINAEWGDENSIEEKRSEAAHAEVKWNGVTMAHMKLEALQRTLTTGPEKRLKEHTEAVEKLSSMYSMDIINAWIKVLLLVDGFDDVTDEITRLNFELEEKQKDITNVTEDKESLKVQYDGVVDHIRETKDKIAANELQQSILSGDTKETICPTCGNPFSKEHLLKELKVENEADAMVQLAHIHAFLQEDEANANLSLANMKLVIDGKDKEITTINNRIAIIKSELDRYQKLMADDMTEVTKCKPDAPIIVNGMRVLDPYGITHADRAVAIKELSDQREELRMIERNMLTDEELANVKSEIQKLHDEIELQEKIAGDTPAPEATEKAQQARESMLTLTRKLNELTQCKETLAKTNAEIEEVLEKVSIAGQESMNLNDYLCGLMDPLPCCQGDLQLETNGAVRKFAVVRDEYVHLMADLKMYTELIDKDRQRLAAAEADRDKVKKINETAKSLRLIADMLSREGLPAAFMQEVFSQLTLMVQYFLSQMEANFTVRVDETRPCSFLFQNENGYELPQESLSGGQAVRLALAMLLSAQRLILPEVGLLILDEPTSHVDADGVENMRMLFQNIATVLQNAGMQLIVVDHNPALQSGFVKSIML